MTIAVTLTAPSLAVTHPTLPFIDPSNLDANLSDKSSVVTPGGTPAGVGIGPVTCGGVVTDGLEASGTPALCPGPTLAGLPTVSPNASSPTAVVPTTGLVNVPHLTSIHPVVLKLTDPAALGTEEHTGTIATSFKYCDTCYKTIDESGHGAISHCVGGGHVGVYD